MVIRATCRGFVRPQRTLATRAPTANHGRPRPFQAASASTRSTHAAQAAVAAVWPPSTPTKSDLHVDTRAHDDGRGHAHARSPNCRKPAAHPPSWRQQRGPVQPRAPSTPGGQFLRRTAARATRSSWTSWASLGSARGRAFDRRSRARVAGLRSLLLHPWQVMAHGELGAQAEHRRGRERSKAPHLHAMRIRPRPRVSGDE